MEVHSCSETQEDRDSRAPEAVSRWLLFGGGGVIKRRERRDMLYFFFHSQQTGSEGEGRAAGISTVVLRCAGEVDLKQISILSGRYMMLGFVILHYRAVYQCVFISLWAQIQ